MHLLDLAALPDRSVESFGSSGFSVAGLLTAPGVHVATVRLESGGVIGRHPAVSRQLLVVLTGSATVAGEDGGSAAIGPGQAALWEPGEQHETRTDEGLLALVLEGDLSLATAPAAPGQG